MQTCRSSRYKFINKDKDLYVFLIFIDQIDIRSFTLYRKMIQVSFRDVIINYIIIKLNTIIKLKKTKMYDRWLIACAKFCQFFW